MNDMEKIQRYRELLPYIWVCPRPDCDGKPHAGMPHRHSRWAQRVTGDAYINCFITGRGWGKTRTAAEYVKSRMLSEPNHRVNVVAPTFGVGRDVCIEGESGLLSVIPPDRVANWSRSLGELILKNGSRLKLFGAHSRDDADGIRGSQSHTLWAEELSSWRQQELAWDMSMLANRLGSSSKVVVTSTPKTTPLMRKLFKMDNAKIVGGGTFDNKDNLADSFIHHLVETYEGTRLGDQELLGLLLEDVAGALWTREIIPIVDKHPALIRIVVAVDPPGGHRKGNNAKCGIVVAGIDENGIIYVLAEASDFYTPEQWSNKVVGLYEEYQADRIVAERNFGGAMVESVLKAAGAGNQVKLVQAARGKQLRAEPVVSLYEKKRVKHVGNLANLESQMCSWVPPGQVEIDKDGIETPLPASDYSPDAVDALVWAVTELALGKKRRRTTMYYSQGGN